MPDVSKYYTLFTFHLNLSIPLRRGSQGPFIVANAADRILDCVLGLVHVFHLIA